MEAIRFWRSCLPWKYIHSPKNEKKEKNHYFRALVLEAHSHHVEPTDACQKPMVSKKVVHGNLSLWMRCMHR